MNYFLITFLVIVLDQASKLWIVNTLLMYESRVVIPGFFNLVLVTNKGAAFSMLASVESPLRHYFFLAVGIAAAVGLTIANHVLRKESRLYSLSLGLIAGGAIGNLIDRVRVGAVIDFLDFYIGSYHWPAFNVADSAICLGVGLLFWLNFRSNSKR